MRTQIRILAAAVVIALAPAAYSQTGTAPSDLNKGQNLVATKIASNFTGIAGSEDNALALVNALRTGGEVTLVTTVPPPAGSPPGTLPTTTETTFAVPTKPMGWGNVKHALALAQYQLQQAGITNPTAEQLQTALLGGDLVVTNADGSTTTTALKGILTMRADGMGWGNIAKASGTTLGAVTSKVDMSGGKKPATTTTTTTAAATTNKSKGVTTAAGGGAASIDKGPSKGITTAGGATATQGSRGLVTASGASAGANPSGNAYGRGIVTGAGGGSAGIAATAHGKPSTAGGAGLVTGGGNSAAASGITSAGGGNNAGGNGKGSGNGKGKGG